jgi:O-succinylbenzoic acid--CoA ligase
MANISWVSDENHILINEKLPASEVKLWQKAFEFAVRSKKTKASIFLLTSGTSGQPKLVCISKKAILASAAAVNLHLQVTPQDIWLNPLPLHHIGGLSIYARAFLTSSPVYTLSHWKADSYFQILQDHKVSFSSLVPTQVFDLLQLKKLCPSTVKAIVVGGSHLLDSFRLEAKELNYPLLPSFGASELASQIATATRETERLKVLSHMNVKVSDNGKLCIKSPSLFSYYVKPRANGFIVDEPHLVDGYLETEDFVSLIDGYLEPKGRGSDYVKILGEAVSLTKIERELEKKTLAAFMVTALLDDRKGYDLVVVCETKDLTAVAAGITNWNATALGFERITKIFYAETLARTDLGKIKKAQITQDILQNKLSSLLV